MDVSTASAQGLPPLVEAGGALSREARIRYSRHLVLPGLGEEGQRRLAAARVLVVGAGGLGSPALLYLAAAGVGTIGIVDDDDVETSNLARQIAHGSGAIGSSKAASAAARVAGLNPLARVVAHEERLDGHNSETVLGGYDLVLDGSDTVTTGYAVDDAAAALGIPVVWGSVLRFDGQVSVFWAAAPDGRGIRLRDLHPESEAGSDDESCAVAGVLGALCGTIGSMMAAEAIKLIVGSGTPLLGRVLVVDALDGTHAEIPIRRAH